MKAPWLAIALASVAGGASADPAPAIVSAVTPTAGSAGSAAGGASTDAKPLDPKHILTLTDDPILNKGAQITGEEATGVVAFTFDDGPNPATTPRVIDALEKYNIPATFFIVTERIMGKHGSASRDVLARELAEGFTIGSHSVTHPNLGKADGAMLDKEVDASIRTLAVEANRPIGLFRPPYGSLGAAGRARLKKLDLTEVQWSVDTLDWKAKDPDRLRKKVISMIEKQNGGVVLMHDVKPITAKIIADVFDDLEALNCKALAEGKAPIVPVSLHYFLREPDAKKTPRAIPDSIAARTAAYKAALPARCAARPPEPASKSTPKPTP